MAHQSQSSETRGLQVFLILWRFTQAQCNFSGLPRPKGLAMTPHCGGEGIYERVFECNNLVPSLLK